MGNEKAAADFCVDGSAVFFSSLLCSLSLFRDKVNIYKHINQFSGGFVSMSEDRC